MSEKLHSERRHERKGELEPNKDVAERLEKLKEQSEKDASSARHEHAEKLEEIRSKIETEAKGKHEHGERHTKNRDKDRTKKDADQHVLVNGELKNMAYKRTMKRVQKKLPAPARAFSKVVHNPAVEAVSEVAGKTVARPSGILVGGIFAFLGSSLFLWITKHYGYEYNYLLFALFFIGGFFVGLIVELGLRFANRRSR